MQKTLTPIGNSLGLIIDKAILKLLNIDQSTVLDLRLSGDKLVIEAAVSRRSRIRASTKKMMRAHSETLKKLAK